MNHAQFVDDTILLGEVSVILTKIFKREIELYQEASGSHINYRKIQIYGWISGKLSNIYESLSLKKPQNPPIGFR